MFEVPSAKRVKRSQLFHSDDEDVNLDDSTSLDKRDKKAKDDESDEEDAVLPNYGFEYDFILPNKTTTTTTTSDPQQDTNVAPSDPKTEDPELYSFNLFAPTQPQKPAITTSQPTSPTQNDNKNTNPQPHKISIRSPSPQPETTNPGSLTRHRPESHYFTSALPTSTLHSLQSSYHASAITASTLQKLSKSPWPGTSHPHRLLTLPSHRKQIVVHRPSPATHPKTPSQVLLLNTAAAHQHRRARPSKKRRDLAKLKAHKRQIVIDETKTKEEHEREKKNKKNRERKLKRRAKERREKEQGKGEVGEGGGGGGSLAGSIDGSEG